MHRYVEKLTRNWDRIIYFFMGILLALCMNSLTPLVPAWVNLASLIALTAFFIYLLLTMEDLMNFRSMLLGASAVSLTFAFATFSSITYIGLIQISLEQIAGIFRSLLLASYYSILERLTKFFEDQRSKKREMPKT